MSDDLSLLEAMEHGLEGDGRFLPVKLKAAKPTKKNPDPTPELAAASAVADLERFGRLARFAQGKLIEMGRELKKGSMDADSLPPWAGAALRLVRVPRRVPV